MFETAANNLNKRSAENMTQPQKDTRLDLDTQQLTQLSERDRQLLVKVLENDKTNPNAALVKAAKQYKKAIGN